MALKDVLQSLGDKWQNRLLKWDSKPVEVKHYTNMDEVPLALTVIGAFTNIDLGEGVFVDVYKNRIVVTDCRQALGISVKEEPDRKFAKKVLEDRMSGGKMHGVNIIVE